MGVDSYCSRQYGYAPRGVRLHGLVPGRAFDRVSIVAAKCGDRVVERHEYPGFMNSRLFEFWFMLLLKVIPNGSVIIMDNASWHRKKVLREMARLAMCRIIFLPPYSPDFNKIEKLWANLKAFLRNYMANFNLLSDAFLAFFQGG